MNKIKVSKKTLQKSKNGSEDRRVGVKTDLKTLKNI